MTWKKTEHLRKNERQAKIEKMEPLPTFNYGWDIIYTISQMHSFVNKQILPFCGNLASMTTHLVGRSGKTYYKIRKSDLEDWLDGTREVRKPSFTR